MEDYGIGQFEQLLDTEYQSNVISAMYGWCEAETSSAALGQAHSLLIREDIANPVWQWLHDERQKRHPGNFTDLAAALDFVTCAENLSYTLETRYHPYPEHINQLSEAWQAFQRERAYHSQIEVCIMQRGFAVPDFEIERLRAIEAAAIERNKQVLEWQKQGADASVVYSNEQKQAWLTEAADLKCTNPKLSARDMATQIARKLNLPNAATQTIRRHLANNGFKRNG